MSSEPRMTANSLQIDNSSVEPLQLACMEIWGGNTYISSPVEMPGLRGWIYSKPLEPATSGGDVYYLSVCSAGMLSRIVLADVAGHGQGIGPVAVELRDLVRKHINIMDQSDLMRGINEAFGGSAVDATQYATAAVLGYYSATRELVFANAGHPPVLWYSAERGTWEWLREQMPEAEEIHEGLPLGLISGTKYSQSAVRLGAGDRLILYTDGVTECVDEKGNELGYEGLRDMARNLVIRDASAMGADLLAAVEAYAAASPRADDLTILVLNS
jgi:sigma-B regulation protein RsbU (phosphoserine phosphatase)